MSRAIRSRSPHVLTALAVVLAACAEGAGPPQDAAPTVTGIILAHDGSARVLPAAQVYAAGERVRLQLDIADDHRVEWVGFHVTGPIDLSDSARVPNPDDQLRVLVLVDLGNLSGLMQVKGFARDGSGNRTETLVTGNPVSIFAPVIAPVHTVPLSGPIVDLTYDLNREQLLLAESKQARIATYSLRAEASGPPIATPYPASSLDLTVSGDSLVAFFPETGELGILPLVGLTPHWHLAPLPLDLPLENGALRVSQTNKVLIAAGEVVEYDFTTELAQLRADAGSAGAVPDGATLGASADRATIILAYVVPGGGTVGQAYTSLDNVFQAPTPLGNLPTMEIASDDGGQFLIGGALLNATLASIRQFYPPGQARVSALTRAGDYAYFGYGSGYLRTRVTDGVTLEQVVLPETPARILVLPGDPERVVALGSSQLMVVD